MSTDSVTTNTTSTRRPFAVMVPDRSGGMYLLSSYATEAEANVTTARLLARGIAASVTGPASINLGGRHHVP